MSWKKVEIEKNVKKVYINSCRISALDIDVSFLARMKFD